MRIGLQIPSFTWPGGPEEIGPRLARIARVADEGGFASIWVMDHLFQISMVGQPDEPMLEGYSALNYLAGVTTRARLGTLVTGVVYRPPGLLVKMVTTLDVLSGGRAYLGIGAAWNDQEALGLGLPFPRWPNALLAWRRRCASPTRCGRVPSAPTRAPITSWPRRSIAPPRCRGRTHPS